MWSCPACAREFGRQRAHTCVPALSLEEYLSSRTPAEREIFEAVSAAVEEVDGLIVEAVSVGVFFKTASNFAELRPRREGFALSLILPGHMTSARFRRVLPLGSGRIVAYVHLVAAFEVDKEVVGWLLQAAALTSAPVALSAGRGASPRRRPRSVR